MVHKASRVGRYWAFFLFFGYRLQKVTAERAELEFAAAKAVNIDFKPKISAIGYYEGVTDIQMDLSIVNKGLTPIAVSKMSVEVFKGEARELAKTQISLTQNLHRHLHSGGKQDDKEYQDRHKENCPHGALFYVGDGAPDFEWKAVEDLTVGRLHGVTIQPNESVSEILSYVLTESLFHSANWYRFVIKLSQSTNANVIKYEFVIPLSPGVHFNEGEVKTVRATPTTKVWAPQSPIAPSK